MTAAFVFHVFSPLLQNQNLAFTIIGDIACITLHTGFVYFSEPGWQAAKRLKHQA
jgi:hypothetical protein